jgi:hypothetical protein
VGAGQPDGALGVVCERERGDGLVELRAWAVEIALVERQQAAARDTRGGELRPVGAGGGRACGAGRSAALWEVEGGFERGERSPSLPVCSIRKEVRAREHGCRRRGPGRHLWAKKLKQTGRLIDR